MKNVTISNLTAETRSPMECPIIGLSNHQVEGLLLRNITISFPGDGKEEDKVRKSAEKADSYPEAIKYANRLPAFGFFFWHVANVQLENVSLTTRTADPREAIVLEDAGNVTVDGRLMRGNQASERRARGHPPMVWLNAAGHCTSHGDGYSRAAS